MSTKTDRRTAAIERMVDHVLVEGMAGATLRPLAAAAGTSDRMLLYYFADKDELLTAVLERLSARMMARLDAVMPAEPRRSFNDLLEETWAALMSDELRPYMPLWLDMAAGSARGREPYRTITGRIADGVMDWIGDRLLPDARGERSPLAPKFLAMIEGLYLVAAFGREEVAATALSQMRSERVGASERDL